VCAATYLSTNEPKSLNAAKNTLCEATHFFDVTLAHTQVTVGELLADVGPLATGYYAIEALALFVRTRQKGLPVPLAEEGVVTTLLEEWQYLSESGWPRLFLLPK